MPGTPSKHTDPPLLEGWLLRESTYIGGTVNKCAAAGS
jgi:hypothetical protein